jgi:hypothetical protein
MTYNFAYYWGCGVELTKESPTELRLMHRTLDNDALVSSFFWQEWMDPMNGEAPIQSEAEEGRSEGCCPTEVFP